MAETQNQSKMHKKVTLELLLGLLGVACAFSTVVSELVLFPGNLTFASFIPASAVVAATMVVAFLIISHFQEKIAAASFSMLAISKAVGLIATGALCAMAPFVSEPVLCSLCVVSAFGIACLVCASFCWVCAQERTKGPLLVTGGIFLACLLCLIESLLEATPRNIAIWLVYSIAVVVEFEMRSRGATVNKFPYISNEESDNRSKIKVESTVKFSIDSFLFGLLASVASQSGVEPLCLFAACAAAAVLFIDRTSRRKITERSLAMWAPPLIAGSICGLFLFGDVVKIVALCVITVLFVSTTSVGWMAMVGHVNMSRLSPLRIFSKARRVQYSATLFGVAGGGLIVWLEQFDWLLSVRITVVTAVVLVFVFSLLHKSRFPEIGLEEENGAVNAKNKGMWTKRCRALSEKCDLSERQYEVLVLIAQGRSAKYVEQELSISLSTAQTHIRNIYRKVGVHSRQELLDEIESTKLYGED